MVAKSPEINKYQENITKKISNFALLLFALQRYIGTLTEYGVYFSWILMVVLPFCYPITKFKPIYLILPCILLLYPINTSIISIYFLISFIVIFRNEPIRRIATLIFIIDLLLFTLLPYFLGLNLIEDKMEIMIKGETHTLGFNNPNSLGLTGFYLLFPIYILFYPKNKVITIILLIIISLSFYEITHSRTSYMASIVFIIFAIGYFFNLINTKLKYIIALLPILFTLCIFYVVYHADQFLVLDVLASSRISIFSSELEKFNTFNYLFGKRLEDSPMDCAYMGAVFQGGVFYLLACLIVFSYNILKKFKYLKFYTPIIVSMIISGITETTFSSPTCAAVLFWSIITHKYHEKN